MAMRTKIVVATVATIISLSLILFSLTLMSSIYPRLQVDRTPDAVRLFADPSGTSGTVRVIITGAGTYTITSISVSEDYPPLEYARLLRPVPVLIQLPAQPLIYVRGNGIEPVPLGTVRPPYSTMTISILGIWSYGTINMSVKLTASATVEWTYG